jgi:hypothetical protein
MIHLISFFCPYFSLSPSLRNFLISTAHKSTESKLAVTSDSEPMYTHYKNLEWESAVIPLRAFAA